MTVKSTPADFILALMIAQFRALRYKGATAATTLGEFYPFAPEDVADVHYYKQGGGDGLWFRLHDGRVFDKHGRPAESDRSVYR